MSVQYLTEVDNIPNESECRARSVDVVSGDMPISSQIQSNNSRHESERQTI